MKHIGRVLRTVRHLRADQIYYRIKRTIQRRFIKQKTRQPDIDMADANAALRFPGGFPCPVLLEYADAQSQLSAYEQLKSGRLELLNQTEPFDGSRESWRLGDVQSQRLWTITLHYHEWLIPVAAVAASDSDQASAAGSLLQDRLGGWMRDCGLSESGALNLAWNSFAIAVRIQSWIRIWQIARQRFAEQPEFAREFLTSLWRQSDYLSRNIEWDLRANHLLKDGIGLLFAGLFFRGPTADAWLDAGAAIIRDQAAEQCLADGGHFERSPKYQIDALNDFYTAAFLLERADDRREILPSAREAAITAWSRLSSAVRWMSYPNGRYPLLNDSADIHTADPAVALTRGERIGSKADIAPPSGSKLFPDFGLAIYRGARWSAYFDIGKIGVDYQPGHGHADTLSLCCAYDGVPLFVDAGCYGYDNDDRRAYDRSTAAHNTVEIDGENSSEVWHIFRVGRRASVNLIKCELGENGFVCDAAHNGYRFLKGSPVHRRAVSVDDDRGLVIADAVSGGGLHTVAVHWLLDKSWAVKAISNRSFEATDGQRTVLIEIQAVNTNEPDNTVAYAIEDAVRHPQFGMEERTKRILCRWSGSLPIEIKTIVRPR